MSKESLMGLSLGTEDIEIGGEVYQVREMTVEQATEYESTMVSVGAGGKTTYDIKSAKKKLVQLTLCQNGENVFGEKDLGLVDKLPYSVMQQIFEVASRINKLDGAKNIKN